MEVRGGPRLPKGRFELEAGRYQGLGHVAAPELAEAAIAIGLGHPYRAQSSLSSQS
jgi:hypothetical protein